MGFFFFLRGSLSKLTELTCLFVARFSSPSFPPADHVDDHGNQLADNNGHILETQGSTSSMELNLGRPSNGNAKLIHVRNLLS